MTRALLTAEPARTSTGQVVKLRYVVMRFGDKEVLDHVSLGVAPQERLFHRLVVEQPTVKE